MPSTNNKQLLIKTSLLYSGSKYTVFSLKNTIVLVLSCQMKQLAKILQQNGADCNRKNINFAS
jgi:hypothetical protein